MEFVSQREYARRRGVAHTSVRKAIAAGRISTSDGTSRGKINPELADREWSENTDRSKPRNSIAGSPKGRRRPGEPSEPMELDGGNGGNGTGKTKPAASGYAIARAAREAAQAQLARLTLDERLGNLVDAAGVKLAAFNAARHARDQLLAIPARVAPLLVGVSDRGEIQRILDDELERVCKGLSGGTTERD
jgi:hypothetical protein